MCESVVLICSFTRGELFHGESQYATDAVTSFLKMYSCLLGSAVLRFAPGHLHPPAGIVTVGFIEA